MIGPEQLVAASHAPTAWESIIGVIVLLVSAAFAETLRRLFKNQQSGNPGHGNPGDVAAVRACVKNLEGKVDKLITDNGHAHRDFYQRLGELETEQAVQKTKITHIEQGGN